MHTSEKGEIRLGILSRPMRGGESYGLLITPQADRGLTLAPVSVPLALVPFSDDMDLGQIGPGERAHATYRAHLCRVVNDKFARFPAA